MLKTLAMTNRAKMKVFAKRMAANLAFSVNVRKSGPALFATF